MPIAAAEEHVQPFLANNEDSVSTLQRPLTTWSFETEDETVLCRYADELFIFSRECAEHPDEESALKACGATRHVWDTAEGISHVDAPIDPDLLTRVIQGIELCIQAVSQMQLPPETSPRVAEHVHEMIMAMTERRDDLSVLLKEGRMAFLHRLRASRPAAA